MKITVENMTRVVKGKDMQPGQVGRVIKCMDSNLMGHLLLCGNSAVRVIINLTNPAANVKRPSDMADVLEVELLENMQVILHL